MGSDSMDNLTAAFVSNTAIVRVEGRGSFRISPPLKQFFHQIIDNKSANKILLDMSGCTGMDSTFMGVIAGLSNLLKGEPGMSFNMINLSEKNVKLLVTLGVDRVVDYSQTATSEEKDLIAGQIQDAEALEAETPPNKLNSALTSLEAHETLIDINPDNYKKFKSVLEFLQDDVRGLSSN